VQTGHRGLYITLGAVIVLLVLAGAGLYIPRARKANAGPPAAAISQPATSPAATNAPPTAPTSAPTSTSPETHSTPAPPLERKTAATKEPSNRAVQTRAAPKPAASRPQQESPGETATAANIPASSPADLEQVEHDLDLLTSRAEAVNSSLDGMKQSQASQGLGLRGDIVASQQRMKTYIAKAQSALKSQDVGGAKKYLASAETEVTTLEKFLGR
jgi:hypothetical protein